MSDAEIFQFMSTFKSLTRVFPLRGDGHSIDDMGASYFKALRRFELPQIQAGADRCVQQLKRFPRPAEWIDMIPRRESAPDLLAMTNEQAHEYRRAEALRYEDKPCGCRACKDAEMTEKPLRFVPEISSDGSDRKVRLDDRIVVAGHWAHGQELARWYDAKASFYNAFYAALAKK